MNVKLTNQTILDDIIKQNRAQRKNNPQKKNNDGNKKKKGGSNNNNDNNNRHNNKGNKGNFKMNNASVQKRNNNNLGRDNNRMNRMNRMNRVNRMMDTEPARGGVVIRKDSGRPSNFKPNSNSKTFNSPRLRQPWEQLPTAPLPAQPLKISIRNELAEQRPRRSAGPDSMMDISSSTGAGAGDSTGLFSSRRPLSASAPVYEPRDSLASREEYRIGSRFSTQGMAIDYQLPAGASYDTRRY